MKVYCYSRFDFAKEMQRLGWNDETLPKNVAIISICCTEPVKQHWKSKGYAVDEDEYFINLQFSIGDYMKLNKIDFDGNIYTFNGKSVLLKDLIGDEKQ